MAHNIYRLASTILNQPQFITQEAFQPIASYLTKRMFEPSMVVTKDHDKEDDNDLVILADGKIGVVQVVGSLSYKPVHGLCGEIGTSYMGLIKQFEQLAEYGVKTIVMEFNSGGGQASHLFTTTQTLRKILDDNKIKCISFVDEAAYSAAYALAVIADEVIVHPSAGVGSIGCVVALTDTSKAMEQEGYKPVFVVSTKGKIPYNEDGSFSSDFLSRLQEDVDRLGNEFIGHVTTYTGLPKEYIASTDAGTFHAEKAIEMGLANKVMTHEEFNAYLSTLI